MRLRIIDMKMLPLLAILLLAPGQAKALDAPDDEMQGRNQFYAQKNADMTVDHGPANTVQAVPMVRTFTTHAAAVDNVAAGAAEWEAIKAANQARARQESNLNGRSAFNRNGDMLRQ